MMASDDGLASRLLAAADGAGERMWRLPLHDEYKDGLKSDVADLNNISSQRGAGAIVAGLFMREFTAGVPWAHLDIAGTAFTERELPLGPKGATGVGVRTLLTLSRERVDARRRGTRDGGRRRPPHPHRRLRRHAAAARAGGGGRTPRGARARDHRSRLHRGPRRGDRGGAASPAAHHRARHRDQLRRRGRRDPHPRLLHGLRGDLVPGLLPRPAGGAARARAPHGRAPRASSACRSTPSGCSRSCRRARPGARTWRA